MELRKEIRAHTPAQPAHNPCTTRAQLVHNFIKTAQKIPKNTGCANAYFELEILRNFLASDWVNNLFPAFAGLYYYIPANARNRVVLLGIGLFTGLFKVVRTTLNNLFFSRILGGAGFGKFFYPEAGLS